MQAREWGYNGSEVENEREREREEKNEGKRVDRVKVKACTKSVVDGTAPIGRPRKTWLDLSLMGINSGPCQL